jgi:hypothetical protein
MRLFGKQVSDTSLGKIQEILGGAKKIRVKPKGKERQDMSIKEFRKELSNEVKSRGGVDNAATFKKKVLDEDFGIHGRKKDIKIREALTEEYFPKEKK